MLEFILNILCNVIHDVFIKHDCDTAREKTVDFLRTQYSLNLKTGLPLARTWIRWITPYGVLYSSRQQVQDIEHLKDVLVTSWEFTNDVNILQGSVATYLGWSVCCKFTADCAGKRILKIYQCLIYSYKNLTKNHGLLF